MEVPVAANGDDVDSLWKVVSGMGATATLAFGFLWTAITAVRKDGQKTVADIDARLFQVSRADEEGRRRIYGRLEEEGRLHAGQRAEDARVSRQDVDNLRDHFDGKIDKLRDDITRVIVNRPPVRDT